MQAVGFNSAPINSRKKSKQKSKQTLTVVRQASHDNYRTTVFSLCQQLYRYACRVGSPSDPERVLEAVRNRRETPRINRSFHPLGEIVHWYNLHNYLVEALKRRHGGYGPPGAYACHGVGRGDV